MTEVPAAVMAQGLTKHFTGPDGRPKAAMEGLSFTIRSGIMAALVGPDGAGKTTLMRMMAGLLRPEQGSLLVLGHDVITHPQPVQDRISYMPQRFGLYEDLSVQENMDLYADLHGVPVSVRQSRFARLLAITDLARFTGRPAGNLSGGMKQKLGLACTLVRSPDLLLLDEPSVGVDPLSRRDLWVILKELVAEESLSVIVSTSYMDEAERCSDVLILNRGCLLAEGAPASLTARAHGLTYAVTPPVGTTARDLQSRLIDAPDQIVDALPKGGAVHFIRQPAASDESMQALLQGAEVVPREAALEDSFMMLLKAHRVDTESSIETSSAVPSMSPRGAALKPNHEGPAIAVQDLVRRFGDFLAVDRTSFEVGRGEIFGLLGPNGAGKTTTFRMLCGLLPASGGHLEVAGMNLRHARARARGNIGYVAQKFALYGNLSVRENLVFFGGAYGLRGRRLDARINDTLAQFDLNPDARSGELPAGYKQRLAMAVGLLHEPEILFLDEPTSGIDPLARRQFWRTITALAQDGVTIIITTHFMEEAEYCDRIAIQDAGRLLALGTPTQVREQAGGVRAGDMDAAFIAIVEHGRLKAAAREVAA